MKTLFVYIVDEKDQAVLAGLPAAEWLKKGLGDLPSRVIKEGEESPPPISEYFALLYPSTPLITAQHLLRWVQEIEKRGFCGLEIGKGFLVKTQSYQEGLRPKRRATDSVAAAVETPAETNAAEKVLYKRIADLSVQNGAIIPDAESVKIDALSTVEKGATVEPYCIIKGSCVHSGAVVGSFSELVNAKVGEGAHISRSVIRDSVVGAGATVGPFAYIRNQSDVGEGARIGDFVEIKNSTLGTGVKAAHLAYVGDASVGEKTNVGCGTVFANYDGKIKQRTTVGKGVFIGANTNLIAPVAVGDNAYIAAATTVTREVPQGAFVIGRVRAESKQKK